MTEAKFGVKPRSINPLSGPSLEHRVFKDTRLGSNVGSCCSCKPLQTASTVSVVVELVFSELWFSFKTVSFVQTRFELPKSVT